MRLSFDYLSVFLQVTLVSLPFYWLFYVRLAQEEASRALDAQTVQGRFLKITGLVFLTNACVHPLVFFGFMSSGQSYLGALLWGQVFSIVGNAVLQSWAARIAFSRSLAASFIASTVSWQLTPLLIYGLYY